MIFGREKEKSGPHSGNHIELLDNEKEYNKHSYLGKISPQDKINNTQNDSNQAHQKIEEPGFEKSAAEER